MVEEEEVEVCAFDLRILRDIAVILKLWVDLPDDLRDFGTHSSLQVENLVLEPIPNEPFEH